MQARFIGDADGHGPASVDAFGLTFEKGVWRDVPADVNPKLFTNTHFETAIEAVAVDVTPVAVPEAITDLDPPPAPVKRGRGRKA